MKADLFIHNAVIVTVNPDREVLWNGALAVRKDRIVALGDSSDLAPEYTEESAKVIDAGGKILFPGFVNTHNHLFQNFLKGLGDDMVLSDWLRTMTFPAAAHLTPEDCHTSALLGCCEGMRSGITTMLDFMYPHPRGDLSDPVIQAFQELKLRAVFARGSIDAGEEYGAPAEIMQDASVAIKDAERLIETYHNSSDGRIKVWVAPNTGWNASRELLSGMWELVKSRDDGTGYTIHISETPFDREVTRKMHGKVDAELLQELGIVGPRVLMVHCVHLTERDIRMAKFHDIKISHNTVSNMYLSSGVAPVPRMLESGVSVSLGVDGAASNNGQDMLELMKSTALLHKVSTLDPTIITAERVLEMATIEGARCLGMENEVGSLEVGKKADIVFFDFMASPKSVPMHNPVSTLVYSSSEENIHTVVVDGEIIMENHEILVLDEEALKEKAQKQASDLASRAAIENRGAGHVWRRTAF